MRIADDFDELVDGWRTEPPQQEGDGCGDAPGSRILISAVVIWEISIKRQLSKLEAPPDLLEQLEGAEVDLLPITARHADRVGTLPMHHRDPLIACS